eukprot:8363086-Heterocapsa_arctica.AAC.1
MWPLPRTAAHGWRWRSAALLVRCPDISEKVVKVMVIFPTCKDIQTILDILMTKKVMMLSAITWRVAVGQTEIALVSVKELHSEFSQEILSQKAIYQVQACMWKVTEQKKARHVEYQIGRK